MNMVRFKVAFLGLVLSCALSPAQQFDWKTSPLDGSVTGCTAATADNAAEAIGRIGADGEYYSPSGKVYPNYSSTAKVAAIVLAAQPQMVDIKSVVAHSEQEMPHLKGEGLLSNWFVGIVMDKVSELSGRKMDVGICNFGGIRKGMPQGDVLLDDINSMFPFRNTLVHIEIKGSELRKIFQSMAAGRFQAVGGVKIEVEGGKLASVMVGDSPLDDERIYHMATISFLLDGGDGLTLAHNAVAVHDHGVLIFDAVMEHVNALTQAGESIRSTDERHIIIKK
jgi:2',3'-cyclic-nucleotide 2'-phosphodiesterase (5'-nucleotidase family)